MNVKFSLKGSILLILSTLTINSKLSIGQEVLNNRSQFVFIKPYVCISAIDNYCDGGKSRIEVYRDEIKMVACDYEGNSSDFSHENNSFYGKGKMIVTQQPFEGSTHWDRAICIGFKNLSTEQASGSLCLESNVDETLSSSKKIRGYLQIEDLRRKKSWWFSSNISIDYIECSQVDVKELKFFK